MRLNGPTQKIAAIGFPLYLLGYGIYKAGEWVWSCSRSAGQRAQISQ